MKNDTQRTADMFNQFLSSKFVRCPGCESHITSFTNVDIISKSLSENTFYLLCPTCSETMAGSNLLLKKGLVNLIDSRLRENQSLYEIEDLITQIESLPDDAEHPTRTVFIHEGAAHWKNDDRDWFKAHPGRAHRLRRHIPGEAPVAASWILVQCLAPDTRARFSIPNMTDQLAEALQHREDDLQRLAQILISVRTSRNPDANFVDKLLAEIELNLFRSESSSSRTH